MRIGLIGYGRLGRAFAEGLRKTSFWNPDSFIFACKSETTLKEGIGLGFKGTLNYQEVILQSDIIFICLEATSFFSLSFNFDIRGKHFVSFMAGVSKQELIDYLHTPWITLAMPNIAIKDNKGIIGFTNPSTPKIADLFKELGYTILCSEEHLSDVMCFAGCGMGHAAYILQCFVEAGKNFNFTESESKEIVKRTFTEVLKSDDFLKLLYSVATPGGATEAGVKTMSICKENIQRGIEASYDRMKKVTK